jgi:delta14-sterol reductase
VRKDCLLLTYFHCRTESRGFPPANRCEIAKMAPRTRSQIKLNNAHFEFFGPYLGPIGIILGLPLVCYALVYACNADGCMHLSPFSIPGFPANQRFFTWEAAGVFLGWLAFQAALHLLLPGQKFQGAKLSDGSQLTYKLNGKFNFYVTMAALGYFGFYKQTLNLSWAYDNYVPLMTSAIIFSSALSVYLYARSFARGALLAHGGDTGVAIYDFFIGRELNPRIGSFDLKEWCELYPGMIGWAALNLAMAHKQLTVTGSVSYSMMLVCACQGLYVFDALSHEYAILTTMDITTDGFGFMLAFGDLAWVPFTYSLQTRVLVNHSPALDWRIAIALFYFNMFGFIIFRGSNSTKDQFRRDPTHKMVKNVKTMPTERGTKLIISGFWGVARHINYFGDWLMGLAWCLPTGFNSIIPYFYVIYFGILLVHRDRRDDAACKIKYGKDWDKYCELVPSRIVPFLY